MATHVSEQIAWVRSARLVTIRRRDEETMTARGGSHNIPWRPPPAGLAQLGRYRLLAEIARGGIGAVYVGRADGPTGFRKLVAIKTLRPDLARNRRWSAC